MAASTVSGPSDKGDRLEFSVYKKYSGYGDNLSGYKKIDFMMRSIVEEFGARKVKILELGCGKGDIACVLAAMGYPVTGIDVSRDAIEKLGEAKRLHGLSNLEPVNSDIYTYEPDGKFDVIICSEVLEHLLFPGVILKKARSLLNPGGMLIVTVPNGYGPYELSVRLYSIMKRLMRSAYGSYHVQFFSYGRIRKLLADNGFRILNVGHSDIISGVPLYRLLPRHFKKLYMLDLDMADKSSYLLVSGWYFKTKCSV